MNLQELQEMVDELTCKGATIACIFHRDKEGEYLLRFTNGGYIVVRDPTPNVVFVLEEIQYRIDQRIADRLFSVEFSEEVTALLYEAQCEERTCPACNSYPEGANGRVCLTRCGICGGTF